MNPDTGVLVSGRAGAAPPGSSDVIVAAVRALDRAVEFAVDTRARDGAWYVLSEPRVLENAVAACSLAGVERARPARERVLRWLDGAVPQGHDALVSAADRWLAALNRGRAPVTFEPPPAYEGPQARRVLYLQALGCAVGAEGADARGLLTRARAALGPDRGRGVKPWQRAMLLAFEAIACAALGMPLPAGTLETWQGTQSADGSFSGMPLVTGMLHLALTRAAPDHPMTRRCRDALLAAQQPDGTWRFLVSEVWDTGLMVRALRGHPCFDADTLPASLEFLALAQREDGGWACTAALESDNDSTGNTLLALAGTAWADQARTAAARYALRHRTPEGLWTTWHSGDDDPAPDVVAHMVAGIDAAALPGIDLAPARSWLASLATGGGWSSGWYIPPAYGAAEIGPALGPHPANRAAARELLATQRADGGWPRIAGEPHSSPTATGLALSALTTGAADPTGAALIRGLGFLVDSQTSGGSWHDRPVMYGPRPFLTVTATQVHALAARGLRDALGAVGTAPLDHGPRSGA
ncbi:prenyltransferase/squalene oxidase repeat-containing protein [Streptomyces sp. NPDC056503]|uniref:prenyltransferase/squalene oxidase repeat-containing protein n=1 Tax=Streptomyces sp. NPDC056503 TaxID=3345842 RepID=UPI0036C190BA